MYVGKREFARRQHLVFLRDFDFTGRKPAEETRQHATVATHQSKRDHPYSGETREEKDLIRYFFPFNISISCFMNNNNSECIYIYI